MDRVLRNIFLLLFAFVLTFNVIYVSFFYSGTSAFASGWESVFLPTKENFMGFEYWFNKFSTYPGLKNLIKTIQQTANGLKPDTSVGDAILFYLKTVALPFTIFINIITDIINNIIWLLSLLDPYHTFVGF